MKKLSKYVRVFISSEKMLPEELKEYQIQIAPERMHDAIANSKLMFGESATMASEAAVLGVPAIYIDETGRGYTDDEEKRYGLVYNFKPKDQLIAIHKAEELLQSKESEAMFTSKREKFLKESINPTKFTAWFINNFPESAKIMKNDPSYQNLFL